MTSIEARILRLRDLPMPQLNALALCVRQGAAATALPRVAAARACQPADREDGGSPAAVLERLGRLAGDLQRKPSLRWRSVIFRTVDRCRVLTQMAWDLLAESFGGLLDRTPAAVPAVRDAGCG